MDDASILSLSGEWDLSKQRQLHAILEGAVQTNPLIIDLSEAVFVDSTSLSEMMRLARARQEIGLPDPVFVVNDQLQRVFDIVQFTSLFSIFRTRDEAIAATA